MIYTFVTVISLCAFIAILISVRVRNLSDAAWFQWLLAIAGVCVIAATIYNSLMPAGD